MVMNKMRIVVEKRNTKFEFDPGDASTIEAMFNPARLQVTRSVRWNAQNAAHKDHPEMQFDGADPATLTVDLLFDTYDNELDLADKPSVRRYTDRLRALTTVEHHGDKHRPPVCQLVWGGQAMLFQGVLTQLDIQYTMFMPSGTPVRATCRCSFKSWLKGLDDKKRQNLMSADVAKIWVVKEGQTLATIAAREYGNPAEWRTIAEANDLDDPLALVPGTHLKLPARQVGWRRGV